MCRIGINLTDTTPNGTNIVSALGQYREVGSATWINFAIILNNPQTPDLTVIGSYEVRINVTNNVSDTSEWSNISTFKVSSNCDGTPTPEIIVSNFGQHTILNSGVGNNWVNSVWENQPQFNMAINSINLMKFITGLSSISDNVEYSLAESSYKIYNEFGNEIMDINRSGPSTVKRIPFDGSQVVIQWRNVSPSGLGADGLLGYTKE